MIAEFYKPGQSAPPQWIPGPSSSCWRWCWQRSSFLHDPGSCSCSPVSPSVLITVFLGPPRARPSFENAHWPILAHPRPDAARSIERGGSVDGGRFRVLTVDGLQVDARMLLRFLGITFGFFAVVRTLALDDMVLSLRWFRLPYSACLVMTITLRMIPTLAGDVAQRPGRPPPSLRESGPAAAAAGRPDLPARPHLRAHRGGRRPSRSSPWRWRAGASAEKTRGPPLPS